MQYFTLSARLCLLRLAAILRATVKRTSSVPNVPCWGRIAQIKAASSIAIFYSVRKTLLSSTGGDFKSHCKAYFLRSKGPCWGRIAHFKAALSIAIFYSDRKTLSPVTGGDSQSHCKAYFLRSKGPCWGRIAHFKPALSIAIIYSVRKTLSSLTTSDSKSNCKAYFLRSKEKVHIAGKIQGLYFPRFQAANNLRLFENLSFRRRSFLNHQAKRGGSLSGVADGGRR